MADNPTTSEASPPRVVVAEEAAQAVVKSTAQIDKAVARPEADQVPAQKAADKDTRPRCPHCDSLLEAHHDDLDSQHCYSVACGGRASACCFLLSANGPAPRSGASHPQ